MNIYKQKNKWKLGLLAAAIIIVGISLIYSSILVDKISEEERKKVELFAKTIKYLGESNDNTDFRLISDVIISNETVPVIQTDKDGNVLFYTNIDSSKAEKPNYLNEKLLEMAQVYEPIKVKFEDDFHFVYYQNSYLLTLLKYFPFFQLFLISSFLLIGYFAFSISRKAEQDQVWVGMAKETAHQLGTPISSILAWIENIKLMYSEDETLNSFALEMEKDANRLSLISDRFSKIGSKTKLADTDIEQTLENAFNYIKKRASKKIKVEFINEILNKTKLNHNKTLIEWVIENLMKNALDAMNESGNLKVICFQKNNKILIDVIDSGKGIKKSDFKDVFKPGFSTKKRGWGLGLSLTKRIIENFHSGKIFVHKSILNEGTTFRIILPISAKKLDKK